MNYYFSSVEGWRVILQNSKKHRNNSGNEEIDNVTLQTHKQYEKQCSNNRTREKGKRSTNLPGIGKLLVCQG